jgi:hypothetical protein
MVIGITAGPCPWWLATGRHRFLSAGEPKQSHFAEINRIGALKPRMMPAVSDALPITELQRSRLCKGSAVRPAGRIETPHGRANVPSFLPSQP